MDIKYRRYWIQDFQAILGQQELLLQSYRNYLIFLHSIMAAGAATLLVALHSDFENWRGAIRKLDKFGTEWVAVASGTIEFVLLTIFVIYAFNTLLELKELISNRAENVTLAQRIVSLLQSDKIFGDLNIFPEESINRISPQILFKLIEGKEPHDSVFGFDCKDYERARDYLWGLKKSELKKWPGSTRRILDHRIFQLFLVIWSAITLFLALVLINVVY